MEVCGKYTIFTEKVTSKIQTGMEKSKFHLFGFFVKTGQKWTIQKFYRRCKGVLVTVEDCGHGPVGGYCSNLWVGVTYNQTGKILF